MFTFTGIIPWYILYMPNFLSQKSEREEPWAVTFKFVLFTKTGRRLVKKDLIGSYEHGRSQLNLTSSRYSINIELLVYTQWRQARIPCQCQNKQKHKIYLWQSSPRLKYMRSHLNSIHSLINTQVYLRPLIST